MAWEIIYFKDSIGRVPTDEFLDGCPEGVEEDLLAVLEAVAQAPPPQFAGGGKWEAMRGSMKGYYEIRVTGPGREQFRLFCILENGSREELERRGLGGPAIAVITGMRKPHRKIFSERDYEHVRALGADHLTNHPRRIAGS